MLIVCLSRKNRTNINKIFKLQEGDSQSMKRVSSDFLVESNGMNVLSKDSQMAISGGESVLEAIFWEMFEGYIDAIPEVMTPPNCH